MARLERSALAHYIDATPSAVSSPTWYRIGKDVESMAVELNPDVETTKNILDETSARHKGYTPSMSVDTYYADPDDSIYEWLRTLAADRKKGDECKTTVLEVWIEDTDDSEHLAYSEDVIVAVGNYGGEQGGVQIPFSVTYAGNRKKGKAKITAGVPAFTPDN